MAEATSQLASRVTESQAEVDSDNRFFACYSHLDALSKSAKKPGVAIDYFHHSRQQLEDEITNSRLAEISGKNTEESIAAYHSLLSLVFWLYPNYIGYNRLKNAKEMYLNACEAVSHNTTNSIAYVLGLVIQLRILPFLIKSKKASQDQIVSSRRKSMNLIEQLRDGPNQKYLGLLYDGLGFSYFQFERDVDISLSYLTRSAELLIAEVKSLSKTPRPSSSSEISLYRGFAATVFWDLGICYESRSEKAEGDQMISFIHESRICYQKSIDYARRTSWHIIRAMSSYNLAGTYFNEAQTQIEAKHTLELLKKAVTLGEGSLKWFDLWSRFEGDFLGGSWIATFYQQLAKVSQPSKRSRLMGRSLRLAQRAEKLVSNKKVGLARYKLVNLGDIFLHNAEYHRQVAIQSKRSNKAEDTKTIQILGKALEHSLKSKKYYKDESHASRKVESSLLAGDVCYELMNCNLPDQGKAKYAGLARRYFREAINISKHEGWNEKVAESSWRLAQVFDRVGDFEESASYYLRAHSSYELARASSDNQRLYMDPSNYMLAWEKIERAKLAHKTSKFENASELYTEASRLVSSTRRWQNRSALYRAEALIERAEEKSVADAPQASIDHFAEAIQSLAKLLTDIKNDDVSDSESLQSVADQLNSFCKARMILERSKEAYKLGDTDRSIRGLGEAQRMFSELAQDSLISDSLRSNELKSLASLCNALGRFQLAQKKRKAELYLEAEEIFQTAAEESSSKTLRPLLSGLASFANFLYYSDQIEKSLDSVLDPEQILECDRSLDSAAVMFRKLGNMSFLNMLKASKQILDATIKMNAAEREMEDASVKAKLYGQAQRSLSLASKYYQQLGSSKRVNESLKMIGAVRQHRRLIPLAHDIIAEMASDQIIYAAISTSSLLNQSPENSARELNSAFLVVDIELPKPYITLSETLSFSLTISNIGREPAITSRIDEILPEDFEIVGNGAHGIEERSLSLSAKIAPASSKKIEISAKPKAVGEFVWHPSVVYLDNMNAYRITRTQTVQAVVESDRLAGFASMLEEKTALEEELTRTEKEANSAAENPEIFANTVFSLKERISKIEEDLLRTKNEYEKMVTELDEVRSDLTALREVKSENIREEDRTRLESKEKLLEQRINRRWSLLQQAHLI